MTGAIFSTGKKNESAGVRGWKEFGDGDTNARHWSERVLKVLLEHQETLESLFNR